jgi:hypothetical protein
MRLTQAHTRTATIRVEEFDAGGLQGVTNSQIVSRCHRGLTFRELSTPNRAQADG